MPSEVIGLAQSYCERRGPMETFGFGGCGGGSERECLSPGHPWATARAASPSCAVPKGPARRKTRFERVGPQKLGRVPMSHVSAFGPNPPTVERCGLDRVFAHDAI